MKKNVIKKAVLSVMSAGFMVLGGAQIAPAQAKAAGFNDVLQTNPYASYITDLATKGVVVGYAGNFNPTNTLTRAEFCTLLVKAFNLPLSNSPVKFADSRGHWGAQYIQSAYEAGAVAGTSDTTFEPNANVRREEAAAMVWRLLTKQGVTPTIKDIQVTDADSWANDAVANVLANHLYGVEVQNGAYLSQDPMTRQQVAALFDLALKVAPTPVSVVLNPTSNPSNLIDQQDGDKQLGNITLAPSIMKDNQISDSELRSNLALYTKITVRLDASTVTVSLPSTGSDDLRWGVVNNGDNQYWSGSEAKTFIFHNATKIALNLVNSKTAALEVGCSLVNKNGQWNVVYPQS